MVILDENYLNKSNHYQTLSTGQNVTRLTNEIFGRMIQEHCNSNAEFDSSNLRKRPTRFNCVFFCADFSHIYGRAVAWHFGALLSFVGGLSTRNRLITFFDRNWSDFITEVKTMNTTSVSNAANASINTLISQTSQEADNVGDQLIVLDLVMESAISHRNDSFSTALMTAAFNVHLAYKKLTAAVSVLEASGEQSPTTPSQQKNVDDLRNVTNQSA